MLSDCLDISNSIIFLEDNDFSGDYFDVEFDRNVQSLIHQPNFEKLKGIVIGRFKKGSTMNIEKFKYLIETKEALKNLPIIANVDFGHTNSLITFSIGGTVKLKVDDKVELKILRR